jgi:hypothetical protein
MGQLSVSRDWQDSEAVPPAPDRRTLAEPDDPVLPDVSSDELDVGWGDEPSERDDDWYRRERPPHHG